MRSPLATLMPHARAAGRVAFLFNVTGISEMPVTWLQGRGLRQGKMVGSLPTHVTHLGTQRVPAPSLAAAGKDAGVPRRDGVT